MSHEGASNDHDSRVADTKMKKSTRGGRNAESRRTRKDADETVAVKIADIPIITSRRWYVTLSATIGIVGSILSVMYFAVDYGRIRPIEKDLEESRTLLSVAKSDVLNAKTQLERAEQKKQ